MKHSPAIEVQSLKKTYRTGVFGGRLIQALNDVNLDVRRGEIFGLLGPNGAGKTTFIKVLLGIVRKSGGEAKVLGHSAGSRPARQQVGYLPENLRMPRHLNANTALEYYGNLSNLSLRQVKDRREDLLKLVGLADRARDSVKTYSKGMLQRLGLAQALLHEPPMLILDEPTDGLDPLARSQVRSILQGLKADKGTTIFLNSHILQEVELVCDRVAILDRGELRFVGAVKDLATHLQQRAQQQAAAQAAQEGTASAAAQATQLQVDFELEGAEAAIRKALGQRPIQNWQPLGTHQFHVTTRMPDQAAVDRCVDDLRAAGINIIGLSRRRVTLEAAFLEILAEPAE